MRGDKTTMKKAFYAVLPMALMLFDACDSSDIIENDTTGLYSVKVSSQNMINGDISTRVGVDLSSGSPTFPFLETDTLGIFPSKGDQVSFSLSGNAGKTYATFDGGGWALKNEMTYYAYLPFNRANYITDKSRDIPVCYEGQEQSAPNSTEKLSDFVYMASNGVRPFDGVLSFDLHHIGALARINFTVPVATTFTKLYILAESDVFITKGFYDLSSNSATLTAQTRSDRLPLNMNNQKFTSSDMETSVNYYMMIPPCDCSGQTLKLVLVDSFGNIYSATTREGKNNNFQAGHYYGFTVSDSFTKTEGASDGGGNIGFLVETEEMTNENVEINF